MRPKEYYEQNSMQEDARYIFALIPPEFEEQYRKYIKEPIEKITLGDDKVTCSSNIELDGGTEQLDEIWKSIQRASVIIVNITGFKANVMLGLGVALMKKARVILIAEKSLESKARLPFNFSTLNVEFYEPDKLDEFSARLVNQLEKWIAPGEPKIKSPRVTTLMNNVLRLRREGKYDTALILLDNLDKVEPGNWYINKEWGITYKESKDFDMACKKLEKALELTKNTKQKSEIFTELGVVYKGNNMIDKALVAFEKAENLDQDNADLYEKWAFLYYNVGKYQEAMNKMAKAIKLDENNKENIWKFEFYTKKFADKTFSIDLDKYLSMKNDDKSRDLWTRSHAERSKMHYERLKKGILDGVDLAERDDELPPPVIPLISPDELSRYTKVDCPKECSIDDEIELSIQLTIKKPLETAVMQLVRIPLPIELKESIKLELKLTAPDFQVDQTQKTMTVPINDDSEKVVFIMKPLSIGCQLVEVAVYFNAIRIGYFGFEIQIKNAKDQIHSVNSTDIVTYENPGEYIDHAFLPQSTIGDIKVDRFLHVDCVECAGGFKLNFTLYPGAEYWETENICTKDEIVTSLNDIASYITGIAKRKYTDEEDELSCLENMRGVGQYLFEKLIPNDLRIKVENWPSEKVLCISTNESWIPWELIYDGNGFWGERFLLFRIPRVKRDISLSEQRKNITETSPTTTKIDKIVHVIGGKIEDIYTDKAKKAFEIAENRASVITLEQKSFAVLMKQSGEADLLHFTCHGYTDPSYLQISGKPDRQVNLTIMSMQRTSFIVKNGSIVFSNACNSSSPDVIFGDFTNFGWEFYRKGTALFIGTIGTIPTEYAIEFSGNFYKWVLQRNAGIADAFREAKKEMDKKNNFFHLLYCLYANPILVRNKES